MNIFLIADTHFGHDKLINEGYRPSNYNKLLNNNLKSLPENSILIHLGDVCLGDDSKEHGRYIKPLKCRKWLVKGNHDNKTNNWYLEHGWDFVSTVFVGRYFGKKVLFSHKPKIIHDAIDLNIHGHFHNSDHRWQEPKLLVRLTKRHRLFSAEISKYKPISLEKFINKNYDHSEEVTKLFKYKSLLKV